MRFCKLNLLAYGKFTDQFVDFPAGSPDFHFIVGPNEAGKSTIRDAIADFLFGIGAQSPYNFLHPYPAMRLGGTLEQGANRIEFHRTKRNRQPLRDAADNPLPDNLLVPMLGGSDRAFFERMFGLDHRRLDEGGAEILRAKDDVGRMLFESAAGLTGFGQFRDQLEQEAEQLFSKRHSANRAFYQAQDRLQQAERVLREATLRPNDWKVRQAALRSTQDALEQATAEVQKLTLERTTLERVRRVAGELGLVSNARQERDSLKDAILLPVDAAQALDQAERAIAQAEYERQRLESEITAIEKRLRETPLDERVLSFKNDIVKLTESRNFVHKHEADIQKQEAIVADRCQSMEEDARQLGWSASDLEALRAQLPIATIRAEIRTLIERRGALVTAVELARQAVSAQERDIEDGQKTLDAETAVVIPAALRIALKSARPVVEGAGQVPELERQIGQAERRMTQALAGLKPWSGDVEMLRALPVLDAEAIRNFRDRAHEIEEKRRAQKESLQELQGELEENKVAAARIEKEQHPVTSEALQNARNERDSIWTRIRDGQLPPKGASAKYESAVQKADELADRRYVGAGAATKLEATKDDIARTQKKIEQREKALRQMDADLAKLQLEWAKAMTTLGMEGMKTSIYPGWLERREAALQAAEQRAEVQSQRDALMRRVEKVQAALRSAVGTMDLKAKEIANLSLPELVDRIDEAIEKTDEENTKRDQLIEALRKARAGLPRLRADQSAATQAQARWEESWKRSLSVAGLDPAMSVDAASAALDVIGRIETTLREIRQIKVSRIDTMRKDLEEFERHARELAGHLAPEIRETNSQEISRSLEERLRIGELTARDHVRERVALEQSNSALTKANGDRHAAEATLVPLLSQCGAQTNQHLREAIRRSEKCRQLDDQIMNLEQILAEKGDGLPISELEKEVANEELAAIPARLVMQETDLASAAERRDAFIREVTTVQQDINQFSGQQRAADAEAERQEALADLTAVVKRYVKVKTAARLLGWGVDRYTERKQGPLLAAAADYFRALTCCSFEGLVVDFDRQPPVLLGRRPDGKLLPVGGMSDGTRDPLYLALRLAAVELHLASAQALPFIADDLFMSLDDERARAGFEALQELAMKTQVIYLSHHAHLVPIARQVLGDGMNVVHLPR
jgi:uncharacterized protein YhaN